MINIFHTYLRAFCKKKLTRMLSLLLLFCFCSCCLLYKSGYIKSHNISELYDIELKEYNLIYLDSVFVLVLKKDDKERTSKIMKKKIEYDQFCAAIQIEQLSFNLCVAPGPGYIEFSEKKISLDPAGLVFIFIDPKYKQYNTFQNNLSLKNAINNYIEYPNQTNENILLNILLSCVSPESLLRQEKPIEEKENDVRPNH